MAGIAFLLGRPALAQFNGDFEIRRTSLADENFMDWRAYQYPIRWRYDWYTARNSMRASVGSLSRKLFYMAHDIKLQADLGRYASFLYMQESESFGRDEGLYQEAELRFGEQAHVSLLGWPEPEKRYDNLGAAFAWGGREDMDYARLSYVRQFVQYNDRRTESARAEGRFEQTPDLFRLEARQFWDERLLMSLELKREEPAKFEDKASGLSRRYEGEEAALALEWWGEGQDWLVGAVGWADRERRKQSQAETQAAEPGLNQRMQWHSVEGHAWKRLGNGDEISWGIVSSGFSNRIGSPESSERFRFNMTTTQLFTQWELDPGEGWHWLLSAQIGDVQSRQFDGADTGNNRDIRALEAKGGTGLVLLTGERNRFLFLTTWDLDSFFSRPWDGGNIQMQIGF